MVNRAWHQAHTGLKEETRNVKLNASRGSAFDTADQLEAQLGGHAGIGRQLQSRVASGAITLEQAQKTARQRQTFKKAYGSDWRQNVYGMDVGGLRTGLAGESADDPQYQAAYAIALERRKKMLELARAKLNGGTIAPGY